MLKGSYIKEMARRFKLLYPDKDVRKIIKDRGILVLPLDKYLSSDGVSLSLTNLTCIYINDKIENEYELRLLYLHEIAHIILHPGISALELRKYLPHFVEKHEKEADLFVAEYLLDDDIFEKYHEVSFKDIAREEHVSLKLVDLKFKNLNK